LIFRLYTIGVCEILSAQEPIQKEIGPPEKDREKEILEYDIYVKMPVEETHILGYLAEAEEHIINIRHSELIDGAVKVIVPALLLDEALRMLELVKEELPLEIIRYEPNPGYP